MLAFGGEEAKGGPRPWESRQGCRGPARSQAGHSRHHSNSCWGLSAQLFWSFVVWPMHLLGLLGPGLAVTRLLPELRKLLAVCVEDVAGDSPIYSHGPCGVSV